ncbi:MAG: urea ABC transporter permease subunit UrtB [Thermodesulfobacteriota bacterium]
MKRALLGLVWMGWLILSPAWGSAEQEPARGLPGAVDQLAADQREAILKAVEALANSGNGDVLPILEALQSQRLRRAPDGRAVLVDESKGSAHYAVTGEPYTGELDTLRRPVINNRVRLAIKSAAAQLSLFSRNRADRLAAAEELARSPSQEMEGPIASALSTETDPGVKSALELALALTRINSPDPQHRLDAVKRLAESGKPQFLNLLKHLLSQNKEGQFAEKDEGVRKAASAAVGAMETRMALVHTVQDFFYGLSLGSVLLLAALGLAITFGLMGVINMAHGEMLMLGAYSTYVTQNLFQAYLPGLLNWYLPAAIPVAFCVACATGMAMERCVIRHLYGRPLETLLATWGISLLLIQTVRLGFGAQNVEVANPSWLSGAMEPTAGLVLTYNRVAIIGFVSAAVLLVWLLLNRTDLGLKVRSVTQNRSMASAMGIVAPRVDMWTFGIGSGIAGLGGVALSQVGNVGPELGQSYIVDSFMVVVLGGVGKLAGTLLGAMGLGIVNKFIEPQTGAVLGKIFLLIFVILFIQKRPQGLFAQKIRAV